MGAAIVELVNDLEIELHDNKEEKAKGITSREI